MKPARKKHRYGRRLKIAFLPCFLLSFMICIWGSMEVFVGNAANFRFSFLEAFVPLFALCLASSLLAALIIAIFRKFPFRLLLSLIFSVALIGYVQNVFLNLDLGLMEGEGVDWSLYAAHGHSNLIIWIVALLVLMTVLLLLKIKVRRAVITYGSLVLLLIQGLTFGIVSAQHLTSDASRKHETAYVLAGNEQYKVSPNNNVIVIMLDYFSNDYIDSMLKQFPNALDGLKDFTYYDNCDPTYIGTFPSVVHMLTGHEFDHTIPIEQWFSDAWNSDSAKYFYNTLAQNGYEARFFDSSSSYFGIKYATPYFSNLIEQERTVRYDRLVKHMLKLSLYRYAPHALKQYVEPKSYDLTAVVTMTGNGIINSWNQNAFYNMLRYNTLQPNDTDKNYFIIEFLRGTHPPYQVNEHAAWDTEATLEECAAGYMLMVTEYINQLKALDLYDDATIIVTSDHGDKENSMQVIYFIKEPHVTREKMAVNSAPISHKEFIGTVLHNIGAEYPYGQSIYDFSEDEERERTVMRNFIDTAYPAVPKYMSTATGTHTVMYAYTYEGDRKDLRKQIRRGPTEILPLTESFN